MRSDLKFLAQNVAIWPKGADDVRLDRDTEICFQGKGIGDEFDFYPDDKAGAKGSFLPHPMFLSTGKTYPEREWRQAREELIFEVNGVSDPDEEECLQLAYERMNDESVKVSLDAMHHMDWSTTITDTPEEAAMVEDMVNHPPHYQSDNGIECIDAIRAALGLDGFVAHCRGTAIKYCWRSGKKQEHAEDLRKAAWYLNEAADALEEDNE